MKRILSYVFLTFLSVQLQAQEDVLWKKQSGSTISISSRTLNTPTESNLFYQLNEQGLKERLAVLSETSTTSKKQTITLAFPNSEGILEQYIIYKTANFEPELQAKFPDIQSYEGIGLTDKTARIYFSVAPIGIQTMTINGEGKSDFIESVGIGSQNYRVFTSKKEPNTLICTTVDKNNYNKNDVQTAKTTSNAKQFKTIRLALSCTAEYTAYYGGTKAGALAGMNATLTRVNGIFNKDLSLQVILIANNDALIYTNATTDPYSDPAVGAEGAWSLELQQNLTTTIGNANYDMGHLFGASGGGGDAGCIGCICVNPKSNSDANAKGSAFTSPSNFKPQGDAFDIDFVAHEMGHQLGANHTFSYEIEGTGASVEPGSGSTIMGYAGITDDYDVQNNSGDYFAYKSILQIQNNLATKTCPVTTAITTNLPEINAGADFEIPIGTAFVLTATSSSTNNSTTYNWEQNDTAVTTSGDLSTAVPSKIDGPLFRSILPTNSLVRYMPNYNNVLLGKLTSTWESVATVARTLNFTVTARDNGSIGTAQTNTDAMVVTVNPNAGPFAVTSQNSENESWTNGSQQMITWDVNNTNTLAGSSNVNIKISTDGGLNFDTMLVANTPNDGSQAITVPDDLQGTDCRLLIAPVANIYYAVNKKSFAIGYSVETTTQTYTFAAPVNIPDGVATYTKLSLNIPPENNGEIVDVNVAMNVSHAFLKDVDSYIESPQGTKVTLFNRNCGSQSNTLDLVYDDSGTTLDCSATVKQIITPTTPLNIFDGNQPQGTWTFAIRDPYETDSGILNSASLIITTKQYTLTTPEIQKNKFYIYSNPNNGSFMLELSSDSIHAIQVEIHDAIGNKVYSKDFKPTANFIENIQLDNAASGVYFVTVFDGNQKKTKKMIVN